MQYRVTEYRIARFWAKIDKSAGCWVWTGLKDRRGYGHTSLHGRDMGAHRASYILNYGPIPGGLCVLHHCDNPPCVRPDHLFLGTHADNAADMVAKQRHVHGERTITAKLTATDVLAIRTAHAQGWYGTDARLARKYNVSREAIRLIVQGITWRHLLPAQAIEAANRAA